jgi:virginiamycin B lyase
MSDEVGVLSRVDPSTNRVTATIKVKPYSYAAVFGFGRVWITNTGSKDTNTGGTVQCIDPRSDRVLATIKVGPLPRFLAAGEHAVWILNQGDGTVTRINPATLQVAAIIPTEMVGSGGDIDAGQNRVWVRGTKILLKTIDPLTNKISSRFEPPSGSGAVRVAGDLVWVSAHDVNTVWILRPSGIP